MKQMKRKTSVQLWTAAFFQTTESSLEMKAIKKKKKTYSDLDLCCSFSLEGRSDVFTRKKHV